MLRIRHRSRVHIGRPVPLGCSRSHRYRHRMTSRGSCTGHRGRRNRIPRDRRCRSRIRPPINRRHRRRRGSRRHFLLCHSRPTTTRLLRSLLLHLRLIRSSIGRRCRLHRRNIPSRIGLSQCGNRGRPTGRCHLATLHASRHIVTLALD